MTNFTTNIRMAKLARVLSVAAEHAHCGTNMDNAEIKEERRRCRMSVWPTVGGSWRTKPRVRWSKSQSRSRGMET